MNLNKNEIKTIFQIVALLVIITLLCMFGMIIFIKTPYPTHGKFNDSVISKLNTGDIILVPYSSKHSDITKIFTGKPWTHASLVFRKNSTNEVFIIELARYDDVETRELIMKGVLMLPIELWMDMNKIRETVGLVQYMSPSTVTELLIQKSFNELIGKKANNDLLYWANTLIKRRYFIENDDYRTHFLCTELIAKILQDNGMIGKQYLARCYAPADFLQLPEYSKTLKILSLT